MAGQTGGGGWGDVNVHVNGHTCRTASVPVRRLRDVNLFPVSSLEHTIFARHRVAFGTCVCLHVCTEED